MRDIAICVNLLELLSLSLASKLKLTASNIGNFEVPWLVSRPLTTRGVALTSTQCQTLGDPKDLFVFPLVTAVFEDTMTTSFVINLYN